MSDNIKVVVKVRPLIQREVEEKLTCQWRVKNNTLHQLDQNGRENGQCFTFDKVYDKDTKTTDVYEDIAKPIVESATVGINGTIFAYGQTSSGKTYTMTGTEEALGIIPLAVYNLFEKIKTIPDRDFLLRVSYIEIYNDKIIDLLEVQNENIKIHDTAEGVRLYNVTEKVVSTPEELLGHMKEGDRNRQIGTTNMNEKSSRSHSIFQIIIESREHAEDETEAEMGCVNVSQLNLVDLAGSERAAQTGATGSRFKEGTFINRSLSVLGLVIKQLSEDNKFVNFRDSKLTRILQNSLGGNAKTSIICAITPAAMEETLSTLQFANRAKSIKNKPEVNAVATNATMIQKLTKQLAKLQYELENKRYLEQDNIMLTMKIDSLQRNIINGFNQRSHSMNTIHDKNRRKTWCAPRRATVSTLHSIAEDQQDVSDLHEFSTPAQKHTPISMDSARFRSLTRSVQMDRISGMSHISEESTMSAGKLDGRVSEVIDLDSDEEESARPPCSPYHQCYSSSKTPPCVLRDKAQKAEKMYQDIVDFTEREKIYPPNVVEYIQKIEENKMTILNLEEKVDVLSKECRDKDDVIKSLNLKVTDSDELLKNVTSKKEKLEVLCQELKTKLTDLEVSYETLKKKSKTREMELLSLLEEQNSKLSKSNENAKKIFEKEFHNFMDLSKDISLVNSDNDGSINNAKDENGTLEIQSLVSELRTQLYSRSDELIKLQEEIENKTKKIISLENTNAEIEEKVTILNNKIVHLEVENSSLKSSVETLNTTIEQQRRNLDDLHSDAKLYNDLAVCFQNELNNSENQLSSEKIGNKEFELMFLNEKKLVINNENLKQHVIFIQKLNNLISMQKQQISELETKANSVLIHSGDSNLREEISNKEKQIIKLSEELLQCRQEGDKNIAEIKKLTLENSSLLQSNQNLLMETSEIELFCNNLKAEMKNVLNEKNIETNNLISDLENAELNLDRLTHDKITTEKKNEQLTVEVKDLELKMRKLERENETKTEKQVSYYLGKFNNAVNRILKVLRILEGTGDEISQNNDIEEVFKICHKYIDLIEPLVNNMKALNCTLIQDKQKLKAELSATKEKHENDVKSIELDINKMYMTRVDNAVHKVRELLNIFDSDYTIEKQNVIDIDIIFDMLIKDLNILQPLIVEMQRRNEEAIKNSFEIKEKHETEIQSLQSQITVIKEKHINTENQNNCLSKQCDNLINELKNVKDKLAIKDKENNILGNNISSLGERNVSLESKLNISNDEITALRENEIHLKSRIIALESLINEKCLQCEKNGNILEELKQNLIYIQNTFTKKYDMLLHILDKKSHKLLELTQKLLVFKNELQNKSAQMEERIHNLLTTLANDEKFMKEIINKLKSFCSLSQINSPPNFENTVDSSENKTKAVLQFLDTLFDTAKIWNENQNNLKFVQEKLTQLQVNYDLLLQNFNEMDSKYKLSLSMLENAEAENLDLNNNLIKKTEDFELQRIQINSLHSNIRQLTNKVKSLEERNSKLQNEKYSLKTCVDELKKEIKGYSILKDCGKLEDYTLSTVRKSISEDTHSPLNCPRTLISICCNRIKELLSTNEHILDTLSPSDSELQIKINTVKPSINSVCSCSASESITSLRHENDLLKNQVHKLEASHDILVDERNKYEEEINNFIQLTSNLHKKITNHRTNLSTLTATTYTENKLLRSQVKVLQHHLKRVHNVCQKDMPVIKTQLSKLLTVLQSDPNYFNSKLELSTFDSKFTQFLNPLESTIESDMLMLDTSMMTFTSDNTLIPHNQTDLDLSQTLSQNYSECQLDPVQMNTSNEGITLLEKLEIINEENNTPKVKLNDYLEVPNKTKEKDYPGFSKQENNIVLSENMDINRSSKYTTQEIEIISNVQSKELEELQMKWSLLQDEKGKLEEKLKVLPEHISEELSSKIKKLEQECTFKDNEVIKLQNSIHWKNEQLSQLQEDVDSLSTQVMDNISEVDSLKQCIDVLQTSNSKLNEKCLELQNLLIEKSESYSIEKKETNNCQECLVKNKFIQQLQNRQPRYSESDFEKIDDKESNTNAVHYRKIKELSKVLQNELDASVEDCQKLNDEFATIKSQLENSNLSNTQNLNLNDTNVFGIIKDLKNTEPHSSSNLVVSVPDINKNKPIDLYISEKMECLNFYAEGMGVEKENLNHNIKIIDIMRMLYNDLNMKHGDQVENLCNKLKDFQMSKDVLKEQVDLLSLNFDEVNRELEENRKCTKLMSDKITLLQSNTKELQESLSTSDNSTQSSEWVSKFKTKILSVLDIEFSTSTLNVFEALIDNIANKQEKDLLDITDKYSQLQGHMEKLVIEQNNLNENLVQMKSQLLDKESKYNALKMQKEKIHEINNAVTLDIIRKEEQLNEIATEGWQTLVSREIIKAEGNFSSNEKVQKVFEACVSLHQKVNVVKHKYEEEIQNLKTEIQNTKLVLEDKAKECALLRNHSDTIQEINQSLTSQLQNKEEQLKQLMVIHEEVSLKCQSQSMELTSNSNKIIDLSRDITALKEILSQQEYTIRDLECQMKSCEMEKQCVLQKEEQLSIMLQKIQILEKEYAGLKAVNDAITKEKEHYSKELENCGHVINTQKEELQKITDQTKNLQELLDEKIEEIGKLQVVGKTVLEENDNLRRECARLDKKIKEVLQQCEENENDYKRLQTNIKTHEKTAEIQSNIIKKLQKQKEDNQTIISEKDKSLKEKDRLIDELNVRCTELLTKYELAAKQLKDNRSEFESINNGTEVLESRLRGLERDIDDVKSGRGSLESEARRRRRSVHDAQRAIDDNQQQEDNFLAMLDSGDQNPIDFAVNASDTSSSGGFTRPSSRRESGREKYVEVEKDDSQGRLSDVTNAARRRRQSVHDLRRSVRSSLPPTDTSNNKETKQIELELPEEIQSELRELRDEVQTLRLRCVELDEECNECVDAMRERESEVARLFKEIVALEAKLEKTQNIETQKATLVEAAVNTDEDWSNLHAVVVDRMSYDAEIEKNRQLMRALEELQRRHRDLRARTNNVRLTSELEAVRMELETCKQKYENLEVQYKSLQAEKALCARRLQELEALQAEDDKENRITELARHKRRSVHDQNRPHDHDITVCAKAQEESVRMIQQLKEEVERYRRAPSLTVATGSAIVQNQQISDTAKENHRLKLYIRHLKKKYKIASRDEDTPVP